MNIKLVTNIEDGIYSPINRQVMLQTVDDSYQLENYSGKKLYILNTATNERFEILPTLKKYSIAEINYAAYEHDYIVFTSAEYINATDIRIIFYMYNINDESSKIIKTIETSINSLQTELVFKVFVLDDNFIIFETVKYNNPEGFGPALISRGLGEHDICLCSIEAEEEMNIDSGILSVLGIDKIIPLHGNICAIKLGSAILEEKVEDDQRFDNKYEEIVGLINVKQFISDIKLNQENIYIDVLDKCDENTTFPYMIQYGNELVYSRVDVKKRVEEVIIYDYENKVKKVRLNSDILKVSDLSHTYILDDMPCVIRNSEDATQIINLNTQKIELSLDSKVRIEYILGDLIVTQRRTDRKLLKNTYYIDVFVYPDMEQAVFSSKGSYKGCIEYFDDLIIFTN